MTKRKRDNDAGEVNQDVTGGGNHSPAESLSLQPDANPQPPSQSGHPAAAYPMIQPRPPLLPYYYSHGLPYHPPYAMYPFNPSLQQSFPMPQYYNNGLPSSLYYPQQVINHQNLLHDNKNKDNLQTDSISKRKRDKSGDDDYSGRLNGTSNAKDKSENQKRKANQAASDKDEANRENDKNGLNSDGKKKKKDPFEGLDDAFVDKVMSWSGTNEEIKEWLDRGLLEANVKASMSFTPLHNACNGDEENLKLVELLVEYGANVNTQEEYGGQTSLHVACDKGYLKTIQFLIDHGADLEARDFEERTPLQRVLQHYRGAANRSRVVKLLIDNGANVNMRVAEGNIDDGEWEDDGSATTLLHVVCDYYDPSLELAQLLVGNGAKLNAKENTKGNTPIHRACSRRGNSEIIKLLIKSGADINIKNDKGQTPVDIARMHADMESINLLIEATRSNVDRKGDQADSDTFEDRALMWNLAKKKKKKDPFEVLEDAFLDKVMSWNGTNQEIKEWLDRGLIEANEGPVTFGKKRLHNACDGDEENFALVELLVKYGANVNMVEDWGQTPLHLASQKGHLKTIQFLIDHGADLEARDSAERTALYIALHDYLGQGDRSIVAKLLIDNGANVNMRVVEGTLENGDWEDDGFTTTLLHLACRFERAQLLVCNGAKLNVQETKHGNTPIHVACGYRGSSETIKLLIQNGANVDIKNNEGRTPLHIACERADFESIKLIIEATSKSDLDTKDKYECTPLRIACEHADFESIKLIIETGNVRLNTRDKHGFTPLRMACVNNNLEAVKLLVAKGANLHVKMQFGMTALYATCEWYAREKIVKFLLSQGAENTKCFTGKTPLHIACMNGTLDTVGVFVQHGCDVNPKDNAGKTPLQLACEKRHLDVAKFLIANNGDLNAKTKKGETALYTACAYGRLDVAKFLITNGADATIKCNNGKTPLIVASRGNYPEVVCFLMRACPWLVTE